jgi:nucleoside-diphosphate-sugar epimerase
LYRLALEKGVAGGRYHAVGDSALPTKEIADTIARKLGVPVESKSNEEALALMGFIGFVYSMDVSAECAKTCEELKWAPTQPGLIADLEDGDYFAEA